MDAGATDADWLAAAARLASRGRSLSSPNPSVGSIIVRQGLVVGRGWTQPGGRPHAEAMALAQAGEAARGATLYATLEPCAHPSERGPTCSHLIVEAGVSRVVYALVDPDPRTAGAGIRILEQAGVEVTHMPSAAAEASLAGYMSASVKGRPFVTLKLAMSLDGFIALPSGESQWITSEAARQHVHARRAQNDAILVGGGTWRADNPRLDVRLAGLEGRSPRRVVLTRGIPIDGVTIINTPGQIAQLEDVHYLYVEGGAETASAFLSADLVDRIELYRAPILLGGGKSGLSGLDLTSLADAHGQWALAERTMLGSDTYEAYVRADHTSFSGA